MNKPSISTIITIAFLVIAIGVTTYLALQQTLFQSEAGANEEPKFITVSNENTNGFTVTWITTKETQGTINVTGDTRIFSETERGKTHVVEIFGLQAGKRYIFSVQSGEILNDNEGLGYEAYTTKVNPAKENKLIFGRIFGKDSTTTLVNGFVTLQAEVNEIKTNKIYSLINEQGGWQIDKSTLLTNDLLSQFDYTQKALVTIGIYSPEITEPVFRTYDLKLSETLQITDIFLGEDVPWELPAIEDEEMVVN